MKTCPGCNHQNSADAMICESCGYRFDNSSGWAKTKIRDVDLEAFAPGYLVADRYEIVREIGRGGMGVVYLVRDMRLQSREMALKIIHPQLVELPEARQRFEQEVNTCLDLLHSNIVRVHNLEEWQGLQFFTMEYITGRSLQALIAERRSQKPPFNLSETAAVIIPLLEALSYAHQYTIHRDVKPDNIIVLGDFPDVGVKVLDFGIAKTLSPSRFTQTAQVLGTAYYMAPEQMSGGEIDHRADLYSVGMVLYEMLTGEMALGRFRLPGEIYTGVPEELDVMLEMALAHNPQQRYPDATSMQQALQHALPLSVTEIKVKPPVEKPEASTAAIRPPAPQKEVSAERSVPEEPRRRLSPWVYACAVALVAVAAAGVFYMSRDKKADVAAVQPAQQEQTLSQKATGTDKNTEKTIESAGITRKPSTPQVQTQTTVPAVSSKINIFYLDENRVSRMRILAATSWEGETAAVIKDFQDSGIKIAKMPASEVARAMEVGIVDGVLTASEDLIAELKQKFPRGVLRGHPDIAEKDRVEDKKVSTVAADRAPKDSIPSGSKIKGEAAGKEPGSLKPVTAEAFGPVEKDWSNDWSVVQELAGYTLNNGPYKSCPASYKGFKTADTISGPIVIHISDKVQRPNWIAKGKFVAYSGSADWRWTVKDEQTSSVQVIDVLGGGFPKAVGNKEIKPSFAVTLGLDPHYPVMKNIDDWFVFPYIVRPYHLQLIENLAENFVRQKVDTPLGSIECYKLQYPERAPDTGELQLFSAKGGGGTKLVIGAFNMKDQGSEIEDGKHAARSVSRYLDLQVQRSPQLVINLWYDVNTGILVKGVTHKAGEESVTFVLKDTNIEGLALGG